MANIPVLDEGSQSLPVAIALYPPLLYPHTGGIVSGPKGALFNRERDPFDLERDPSDLKRDPSDLKRDPFDLKRDPFDLERDPFDLKRDPFDLKRDPSDLKRDPFDLKRDPFDLERDPSDLKRIPFDLKRIPFDLNGIPFTLAGVPFEVNGAPLGPQSAVYTAAGSGPGRGVWNAMHSVESGRLSENGPTHTGRARREYLIPYCARNRDKSALCQNAPRQGRRGKPLSWRQLYLVRQECVNKVRCLIKNLTQKRLRASKPGILELLQFSLL
ncbi:MAG: hypothetical protein LBI86_02230 [Treponema sp.]|jgi:hypothetical protein|nr:hypothetical protein [Treponema sp.]